MLSSYQLNKVSLVWINNPPKEAYVKVPPDWIICDNYKYLWYGITVIITYVIISEGLRVDEDRVLHTLIPKCLLFY